MDNSGSGLEWQELGPNDFICQVHLRHFCSGRLIQISHRMLKGRLTYKVVL
jgi:hypothetical protein